MNEASMKIESLSQQQLESMHLLYRLGGKERLVAPHVVYSSPLCPYEGCEQRMQAIDFRLEAHGRETHDTLVRAWWDDIGFVGGCPTCGGLIHFTIRGKQPIAAQAAAKLPQLPENWAAEAVLL